MKYTKHGETISVNIGNGYSVFCMAYWNTDERHYDLTLYLQDDSIEFLKLLQDCINIPLQAKKNTLYSEIIKYIEYLVEDRFFVKHIKAYEFEMECFDKGIELINDEPFKKEYEAVWD